MNEKVDAVLANWQWQADNLTHVIGQPGMQAQCNTMLKEMAIADRDRLLGQIREIRTALTEDTQSTPTTTGRKLDLT